MPRHTWELVSRERFNGRVNYTVKCSNCGSVKELTGKQYNVVNRCSCMSKNPDTISFKVGFERKGFIIIAVIDSEKAIIECKHCGVVKKVSRSHFRSDKFKECKCKGG